MEKQRRLTDLLNRWAHEYYVLDNPTVSDKEYDQKYDELRQMEERSGVVFDDSPTRRVGGDPVKDFAEHRHIARLYSLDKCTTEEGLRSFIEKVKKVDTTAEFCVEYKFDGLTVCLTYENGKFVRATTRGNGVVGEDVTAQVLTVQSFPLVIPYQGVLEVRGEAIIRLSTLQKYNETATEPLKNARNAVAGAIRNLDPKITKKRGAEILFYDVNFFEGEEMSQVQAQAFLKEQGFKVFPSFTVCKTADEVVNAVQEIERARHDLDVLTDGAVIKTVQSAIRAEMGATDKFPRWAIAYKFEAEEVTTTLKDVVWQVGRTGKLTPLALLEPVELAGATVSRATLNNYADVVRKDVKIGSRVLVRRSNEVIPEILRATEHYAHSTDVQKPTVCPYCGSALTETGANLFCENERCEPRLVAKLDHYAGKNAMDIDGFSESTARALVREKGVVNFSDLYRLTREDLQALEGFKDKKTENLLRAIEKSKSAPLDAFIYAVGVGGIGRVGARDLAKKFGSIDGLKTATVETLTEMENVGEITAKNVVEFFSNEQTLLELDRLKAIGIDPKEEQKPMIEGIFSGEKVVLTGKLSSLTRGEAQKKIESEGGECLSSVTAKTTLVVAGEDAGSKLQKAQKLGLRILDEAQFLSLFEKSE